MNQKEGRILQEPKISCQAKDCLEKLEVWRKNNISQTVFVTEFKSLLDSLDCCLSTVKSCANQKPDGKATLPRKIILCLSQISKILQLYKCLLKQPPHRQNVWYLSERLQWCISELARVYELTSTDEDLASDDSGSFLLRMDLALQLLDSEEQLSNASLIQLLDDLIQQAVTIAKISSILDYKEITATCHKVLEESKQLENGEAKNQNEVNLLKSSLSSSLLNLELRVNTALLRLFLEVFVEPHKVLKQLVRLCADAPHPRVAEDLEELVDQLDNHVERVLLIGQFAVSCCEQDATVTRIKCCLASVESVDNYLVPALRSFYLSSSEPARDFVRFLSHHWQDELSELHNCLDSLIDSYAFSRVVQEKISDDIDIIKKQNSEDVIKMIVKEGWFFYKHVSKTKDPLLANLKQAIHEYEAAVVKKVSLASIVKRADLLASAVDKVSDQLSSSASSRNTSPHGTSHTLSLQGGEDAVDDYKSIRDIPLSISIKSSSKSQYNSYRPHWLQKKIQNEKEKYQLLQLTQIISKDNASVVEKTVQNATVSSNGFKTPISKPKQMDNLLTPFLSQKKERNTTLYVQTPRKVVESRVLDFTMSSETSVNAVKDCDSLVLEITDILENLSAFAETLSSSVGFESLHSQDKDLSFFPKKNSTDLINSSNTPGIVNTNVSTNSENNFSTPVGPESTKCSLPSYDASELNSLMSVRTDQVSDFNTPERLQDLKYLDERIQQLKML